MPSTIIAQLKKYNYLLMNHWYKFQLIFNFLRMPSTKLKEIGFAPVKNATKLKRTVPRG